MVRFFTTEELKKTRDSIIKILENKKALQNAFIKSKIYKDKYYWKSTLNKGYVEEIDLIKAIHCRLFWYLHIANTTAFALQFKEQPFFDYESPLYTNVISETSHEVKIILEELLSIAYNLSNDGNSFLSIEWEELFENIIESLETIE